MFTSGVVINVRTTASSTNMEKTFCVRMCAERPTLRTMSSTKLSAVVRLVSTGLRDRNAPLATHQRADRTRLAPPEPSDEVRGERAPAELARVREAADGDHKGPREARVEQPEVGGEAGEDEVLRARSLSE